MKIVLVGDNFYREKTILEIVFFNLTHRNNVIEFNNVNAAELFLVNQVANKSLEQHIDLIIVDDNIQNNIYQKNLSTWIRSSNESF